MDVQPATPKKITQIEKGLLRLIERSPDIGEGWRQVSQLLWPTVSANCHPQLMELNTENRRIRITAEGETIMRYAL